MYAYSICVCSTSEFLSEFTLSDGDAALCVVCILCNLYTIRNSLSLSPVGFSLFIFPLFLPFFHFAYFICFFFLSHLYTLTQRNKTKCSHKCVNTRWTSHHIVSTAMLLFFIYPMRINTKIIFRFMQPLICCKRRQHQQQNYWWFAWISHIQIS